ncbi:MAG TPA: hypothetical protein VM537_02665 [Anaerolineae bacterium]|nr:hypothetical protein [Anaerolineae bacterium]
MKKPYLLLDAGGTFVFIDQEYLAGVAKAHGFPVSATQVYDEHYRLIHWFDTYVARNRTWPPRLDRPYTQVLFEAVGLPEGSAAEAARVAEAAHKEKNLWTFQTQLKGRSHLSGTARGPLSPRLLLSE